MDNILLKKILTEYEAKRNQAIQDAEYRKEQLISTNPELSRIEKELSDISIETAKLVLKSDSEERQKMLASLKRDSNKLIKEKNAFIKQLSKESNFLQPKFECKICKDTGFIEKDGKNQMCSCLTQRLYDATYNKSNMGNLERENFETFNLIHFSDKPNKEQYHSDISPRENMQLLREKAKNFIDNFEDPNEKNLIFIGSTGTGKTFLSNCIAKELLSKGKTVLYQTAPVMFDNIINAKFGRENSDKEMPDEVLNCDLLIIDDLGTENTNQIIATELFTIINTRLLNQNHKITKTIISTNLDPNQLNQIYSSRIASRLAGNYRFLRFFGEDQRYKRNKN